MFFLRFFLHLCDYEIELIALFYDSWLYDGYGRVKRARFGTFPVGEKYEFDGLFDNKHCTARLQPKLHGR